MTIRRQTTRRVEEEIVTTGVPPLGNQVPPNEQAPRGRQGPQVCIEKRAMSKVEIRMTIQKLTHVLADQVTRDGKVQVNTNARITASRIRDFTRMNPFTFFGPKVEEDAQGFIDGVFKVLDAMGVSPQEKAKLSTYQLNDIAQVLYEQWKEERPIRAGPIDWGSFKMTFLDRFFPLKLRERKMKYFINLRHGGMTVKEYSLKFTQ
ncbi:hypothetical protein RDI58_026923 [Solanum bulbocastanum]|uniref:Retrotransposon gag domain-containing protein n=1 Tax=Solanum bulbocastanum TaxID=147425 RepID=A0AAN8SZX1_SOLBU